MSGTHVSQDKPHFASGAIARARGLSRQRQSGQAAIVIALSAMLLVLIVGLAIDGGSMFNQRRAAQNSSDAVALASTKVMLSAYQAMVLANDYDVDGSATDEDAISSAIDTYANLHGVSRSDLHAYYVNDDKQLVTTTEVGSYGGVPFSLGVKGITIKNSSQTDLFFMKLAGWNKVAASASSTAFMGIVVTSSGFDVPLLPVGFFTDTERIINLQPGRTYRLMDALGLGSGNWGWVSFNGANTSNITRDWINCGFNPSTDAAHWDEWCPGGSTDAAGPTLHYTCANHPDCTAAADEIRVPYLKYGTGDTGWWLEGNTGVVASNCHDLADNVQVGREYFLPMIDMQYAGGQNQLMHLAAIGKFLITSGDLDCNGSNFFIDGKFEQYIAAGGSGRHGDLRHVSGQTVFLEN